MIVLGKLWKGCYVIYIWFAYTVEFLWKVGAAFLRGLTGRS